VIEEQLEGVGVRQSTPVLSVRDLQVQYLTDAGPLKAVNGVSFDLSPGEISAWSASRGRESRPSRWR
jgi:ABC-type microcin C transport system duplicated ATPase subunit YejF